MWSKILVIVTQLMSVLLKASVSSLKLARSACFFNWFREAMTSLEEKVKKKRRRPFRQKERWEGSYSPLLLLSVCFFVLFWDFYICAPGFHCSLLLLCSHLLWLLLLPRRISNFIICFPFSSFFVSFFLATSQTLSSICPFFLFQLVFFFLAFFRIQ